MRGAGALHPLPGFLKLHPSDPHHSRMEKPCPPLFWGSEGLQALATLDNTRLQALQGQDRLCPAATHQHPASPVTATHPWQQRGEATTALPAPDSVCWELPFLLKSTMSLAAGNVICSWNEITELPEELVSASATSALAARPHAPLRAGAGGTEGTGTLLRARAAVSLSRGWFSG